MNIQTPYLLFLGEGDQAKTSSGVAFWRPELCAGQLRLAGCSVDLGLPDIPISAAATHGVKTFLVGVAPHGGKMPEHWVDLIVEALSAGLDVAGGLHTHMATIPAIAAAADRYQRQVFDVRHPQQDFAVGNGEPRSGNRLLTVGTDCEAGKMFTSLALGTRDEKSRHERGFSELLDKQAFSSPVPVSLSMLSSLISCRAQPNSCHQRTATTTGILSKARAACCTRPTRG